MVDNKKGLIVRAPFSKLIVSGRKTMELRSSNTRVRGRIYIIESKSKTIIGESFVINSYILTKEIFDENFDKHFVLGDFSDLPRNYKYVWELDKEKAVIYDKPIPYEHKRGAIIWVDLSNNLYL